MREKLFYFVENIITKSNPINIYQEICEYFEKKDFLIGKANVLEHIWRINGDNNILLEAGNMFYDLDNDPCTAYKFYKEFFSQKAENEFEKFIKLHEKIKNIHTQKDFENILLKNSELSIFYGKFVVIIMLLIFLHTKKEYQLLIEIEKYLDDLHKQIKNFISVKDTVEFAELKELNNDFEIFSKILSETQHHNDINYLAIKYDKQNQQAYLNILDDLLTYEKYKEALDFYNMNYAPVFNKNIIHNISIICWELADTYGQAYNFYKSVFYQKLALEFELGVR